MTYAEKTANKMYQPRALGPMLAWLVAWGVVALLLSACSSQFGLQTKGVQDTSGKYGVVSLMANLDGAYVLQWEVPDATAASGSIDGSFEVYLSKVAAIPASFTPIELPAENATKNIAGVTLGNLPDDDSPAGKGAILTTVRGVKAYTVTSEMSSPNFYIFQVRFLPASGEKETNTRVLLYEPKKNQVAFLGVQSLTRTATGKILLTWASVSTTSASEKATVYQVFQQNSKDPEETIIQQGTAIASLALTAGSDETLGTLVEFPEGNYLTSGGAIINETKAATQLELTSPLSDGFTYVFRVQARTPGGSIAASARAVVYRPSVMTFAGLKTDGVKKVIENSTSSGNQMSGAVRELLLSWSPALKTQGAVQYNVYANDNFVGSTTGTTFSIPKPLPGHTYDLYVTAKDDRMTTAKGDVVSILMPIPTSYEGCGQAQTSGSDSIRIVYSYPYGADQVAIYRNGVFKGSGTSLINVSYLDTGLVPGTTYNYTCHAIYGKELVTGVKSVQATTNGLFSFAGLQTAGAELANDASTLTLRWSAAINGTGNVTYYLFDDAPAFSVGRIIGSTTGLTYTIVAPTRGKTYTLGVKARDNSGFDSNTAFVVVSVPRRTGLATNTTPEVMAVNWSDATAKVKLNLASGTASIYKVYMSNSADLATFDFTTPWETDTVGQGNFAVYTSGGVPYIYVGGQGKTFSGPNYFVVREGDSDDQNTTVSRVVDIPARLANFTRVPISKSRLAYDYYIGTYEASTGSGILDGNDRIATNEKDLTTCSYQFHEKSVAFDVKCGTKASTAKARHVPNVTAATLHWHQAFVACRNASEDGLLVRLPTPEEWRRASRWPIASYETMWNTYAQNNDPSQCATAVDGSQPRKPGMSGVCTSELIGTYDMAGNLREWVDGRLVAYDTPESERRGPTSPIVARLLANGIDRQTDAVEEADTPRYYGVMVGSNPLGLLMGSDAVKPAQFAPKLYEPESESWEDSTQSQTTAAPLRGFRCVAFPNKKLVPTLARLAMPMESRYTSDSPGISPGHHAHDPIPETVVPTPSATDPTVTITWQPWSKNICAPTCSPDSNISYDIYRYREPTLIDARTRINWAQKVGPYATLPSTISGANATGMPLDPLYPLNSGEAPCTSTETVCRLVGSKSATDCSVQAPEGCTFTDSAASAFAWSSLYRYVIVAKDAQGNAVVPEIQRFATPEVAGTPSRQSEPSFRREIRWRRVGGFLTNLTDQNMTYLPLHQTGLDRDIFMQTYAGFVDSGSIGSAYVPPYPATCQEGIDRKGLLVNFFCGSEGWPPTDVKSYDTATALANSTTPGIVTQGQASFACSATLVDSGNGFKYRLHLPSLNEWNAGKSVTDYGASWEWTSSRVDATGNGLDNGIDSLWRQLSLANGTLGVAGVRAQVVAGAPVNEPADPAPTLPAVPTEHVRCAL